MAARHDSELVIDARAGPEQGQQRLEQRDVDHLTAAAVARAVVEGEQDRVVPARPVTPSASPKGGSVGGPSGWPVWWAKPLIASASVPNARRLA